jgi:hypothetical protein
MYSCGWISRADARVPTAERYYAPTDVCIGCLRVYHKTREVGTQEVGPHGYVSHKRQPYAGHFACSCGINFCSTKCRREDTHHTDEMCRHITDSKY